LEVHDLRDAALVMRRLKRSFAPVADFGLPFRVDVLALLLQPAEPAIRADDILVFGAGLRVAWGRR